MTLGIIPMFQDLPRPKGFPSGNSTKHFDYPRHFYLVLHRPFAAVPGLFVCFTR
jgi:hypothetical protein